MPAYDDWNKIDEEEDELQDTSVSTRPEQPRERATTIFQFLDGKRDVVLFCIDCSPSMLELREDARDQNVQTCHLFTALEAAMQFQKRKIIAGPNDSVGILLFNTVRFLAKACAPA